VSYANSLWKPTSFTSADRDLRLVGAGNKTEYLIIAVVGHRSSWAVVGVGGDFPIGTNGTDEGSDSHRENGVILGAGLWSFLSCRSGRRKIVSSGGMRERSGRARHCLERGESHQSELEVERAPRALSNQDPSIITEQHHSTLLTLEAGKRTSYE